jgi:hypothetical protein
MNCGVHRIVLDLTGLVLSGGAVTIGLAFSVCVLLRGMRLLGPR